MMWVRIRSLSAPVALTIAAACMVACSLTDDDEPDVRWEPAFDTSETGTLSAVWGSAPDDIFIVGGTDDQGEIYHDDGSGFAPMEVPEGVPLIVWVYGFGPDDVFAVGLDGSALRYDGSAWNEIDTGTDQDLWGVFGFSPDDVWIVGGDAGDGDPVLLHYDGDSVTDVGLSEDQNPRQASQLFKVWGIDDLIVAVGQRGLILEYRDGAWEPVSVDTNEEFVSLWGTSRDNIVVAGSNVSGQVAHYDGEAWENTRFPAEAGLNGVAMDDPSFAVIAGWDGFLGRYDVETGELVLEATTSQGLRMHSAWADGAGRYYAVGGDFFAPHRGEAYVRITE